jgi:tetratricopeptide (TPR) repeat protein
MGRRDASLAINLNNYAFLLRRKSQFAEAAAVYREAFDIHRDIFGDDHPGTLLLMQNLASALITGGNIDEGIEVLEMRLAASRTRWQETDWQLASAESGLGRALMTSNRPAQAEPHLRAAESIFTTSIGKEHAWTVAARAWIAACAADLGRTSEASRLFDRNLVELRTASLDIDVRASAGQLALHLESAGLVSRAAAYREAIARLP